MPAGRPVWPACYFAKAQPRTRSSFALPCCPQEWGRPQGYLLLKKGLCCCSVAGASEPCGHINISAWLPRRKWRPAGRLQQGQDALTRALAGHLSQLCCCRSLELPWGWGYPRSLASPVCPASLLLSLLVPAACALGVCAALLCWGWTGLSPRACVLPCSAPDSAGEPGNPD